MGGKVLSRIRQKKFDYSYLILTFNIQKQLAKTCTTSGLINKICNK